MNCLHRIALFLILGLVTRATGQINLTIIGSTNNYNVAVAAGNVGSSPNITVTISSGVVVGSANPALPAFTTGSLPVGSTVTIINHGRIQGAGGGGGSGGDGYHAGATGVAGGDALALTTNVALDNTDGQIWGGGGGGGGSGAYWNSDGNTSGSGGGGGAGTTAGNGGVRWATSDYPFTGQNGMIGTAIAGGAGGTTSPWNHTGGAGGSPGQSGAAGSSGNVPFSDGGNVTPGGAGGAAGYAIRSNGRSISWLGGSTASHIQGTNDATVIFLPVITSALTTSGVTGTALSYTITASNSPTGFSATGLPSGLSVITTTGLISGTPSQAGITNVTLGATNSSGTMTATLVLTVAPPAGSTDTTAPTVPSGLMATSVTTASFRLSWNASTDNVGVWSYEVTCNGRSLGTTTALSKLINGLGASTSNNLTVRACDVVGNWSSVGTLSVTTAPPVAVGYNHSLMVQRDGSAWAWGYDYSGQLGDGTAMSREPRTTPVAVGGLTSGVAQVAAGYDYSLALKSDGTVWWWGNSGGPSIDWSSAHNWNYPRPVKVSSTTALSGVVAVTAKGANSAAVKADGTLWLWSGGESGPTQVTQGGAPFTGVVAVALGGGFTLALKGDGTVWTWGYNPWSYWDEDLGWQGGAVNSPVQVGGMSGIVAIATEDNPCYKLALKNDGTVWAWGYYDSNGDEGPLVQVSGLSGIVGIAEQDGKCLALKSDGTVWTWTQDWQGPVVNGTVAAVQVGGLTGVSAIATNYWFSLVARNDGTARAWGSNSSGQLGDGTTIDRATPVAVGGASVVAAVIVTQPVSKTVFQGHPATFSVTATGTPSPTYQWTKNGTAISGATASTYTIASPQVADAGVYAVVIFVDFAGSLTSTNATLVVGDVTPPSAPTALGYAEKTDKTVTLVWRASTDNVGVTGYNVYRDGTLIGTTSELTFIDSGLTKNTTYGYTVKAFDAAGNLSFPATLTPSVTTTDDLSTDTDHDGIPNATETALGTNGSAAASPDTTNQTQQNIHRPAR